MTPEQVHALIAKEARIDPERVFVIALDVLWRLGDTPLTLVAVDAMTEPEQRRIQIALRRGGLTAFSVERREVESKPRHYTLDVLRRLIRGLGEAPEGSRELDRTFALRCAHLPETSTLEEVLEFLRDLRDECVFCAGASPFVMRLLGFMLEEYPESEEAKTARRAKLEARYGLDDD